MHSTRYGRRRHLRRPICSRMMPVVFSNRDDWSFSKCTVAIRLIASAIPVLRSNCNFLVATRLGERTSTRGDRQMTISYHLTSVSCNRLRRKQCIRSIPLRGQNHPQIHASGGLGRGGRGRVASRAPNHTPPNDKPTQNTRIGRPQRQTHPNTRIGLGFAILGPKHKRKLERHPRVWVWAQQERPEYAHRGRTICVDLGAQTAKHTNTDRSDHAILRA